MACLDANAQLREQDTSVKSTQIMGITQRLLAWLQARNHPSVPPMNDHIARDLGLTAADLAQRRHQWPSQNQTHPRL